MTEKLKPGKDCPKTGEYQEVGPNGGKNYPSVKVDKGETMPPTPKKGMTFIPLPKKKG